MPIPRTKWIIGALCASTVLAATYAVRQRVWALELKDQLEATNKDDVKLMSVLSKEEKETICRRLTERGEGRISQWIATEYLTQRTAQDE